MMPGLWPYRSAKPFSGHSTQHQGFQLTGSGCLKFNKEPKGHLVFQDHNDMVEFRTLRLKKLK